MTSKENRRRWHLQNREKAGAWSQKWKRENREANRLIEKRKYFVLKACRNWLQAFQPEIYERFQKQAKSAFPAMMAHEMDDDRMKPRVYQKRMKAEEKAA